MQIRLIQINNFRGIRKLEWIVKSPLICLIGPGDSTKTTILDAIEYVLYPKYYLSFEDCDFFNGEKENPIEIILTLGNFPRITQLIFCNFGSEIPTAH